MKWFRAGEVSISYSLNVPIYLAFIQVSKDI